MVSQLEGRQVSNHTVIETCKNHGGGTRMAGEGNAAVAKGLCGPAFPGSGCNLRADALSVHCGSDISIQGAREPQHSPKSPLWAQPWLGNIDAITQNA